MTGLQVRLRAAGYGDRTVLRDLSFELPFGRITALVGPGGGGKSTLVRTISEPPPQAGDSFWVEGSVTPSGATCQLQAQDPRTEPRSLADWLRPGEDGENACQLQRLWPRTSPPYQLLEACLATPICEVEPGNVARLAAVTGCAAAQVDLRIFDEPDLDMPDEELNWILRLLQCIRGEAGVLVVTHNLRLVREVADWVLFLEEGRLVESLPVKTFFAGASQARTRQFVRLGS